MRILAKTLSLLVAVAMLHACTMDGSPLLRPWISAAEVYDSKTFPELCTYWEDRVVENPLWGASRSKTKAIAQSFKRRGKDLSHCIDDKSLTETCTMWDDTWLRKYNRKERRKEYNPTIRKAISDSLKRNDKDPYYCQDRFSLSQFCTWWDQAYNSDGVPLMNIRSRISDSLSRKGESRDHCHDRDYDRKVRTSILESRAAEAEKWKKALQEGLENANKSVQEWAKQPVIVPEYRPTTACITRNHGTTKRPRYYTYCN